MEKYATRPSARKVSCEKGFDVPGCIVYYFSAALPGCEATIQE
jgi:hypothetical protein